MGHQAPGARTDNRTDRYATVEVNHVLVGHANAARRYGSADIFRLIGAVDPVLRVLAAGVQIEAARTHRVLWPARRSQRPEWAQAARVRRGSVSTMAIPPYGRPWRCRSRLAYLRRQ